MINPTVLSHKFAVPLDAVFNFTATEGLVRMAATQYAVRDVWTRAAGTPAGTDTYDITIGPMDSAFVTLTAQ